MYSFLMPCLQTACLHGASLPIGDIRSKIQCAHTGSWLILWRNVMENNNGLQSINKV